MIPDEHLEAFKFLHAASVPDEKAIDAMSEAEVNEHLAADGFDVARLDERIAQRRKKLEGQLALMAARKRRLAAQAAPEVELLVPPSAAEILAALMARFGDQFPLAARRAAGRMTYDELCQLYRDLMGAPPHSSDAP
jgi:hypothetical protein